MAVRVQNGAVVNFGRLDAETAITHARLLVGGAVLATRPLAVSRTVEAGGDAEFAAGDIDLVFPAGQLEDAGLQALLGLALDGANELAIDAMTDDSTVVAAGGYAQQRSADWDLSTEPD